MDRGEVRCGSQLGQAVNAHNSINTPQRQELWDGICDKGDRVAILRGDPLDDGSLSEGARLWYAQLCGWAKPDGSIVSVGDGGTRTIAWFAKSPGFPDVGELQKRSRELERAGLLRRPRRGVLIVVRRTIEIDEARRSNERSLRQRQEQFTATAKVSTRIPQAPAIETPEGIQTDTFNGEKV